MPEITSRLISDRCGRAASRLLSIPSLRTEAGMVALEPELRKSEESGKAEQALGPATGPVLLDALLTVTPPSCLGPGASDLETGRHTDLGSKPG